MPTPTWTFGQKLGTGFALVVLLTAGMGVVAYYSLQTVTQRLNAVITEPASDLADAQKMRAAMHREAASSRAFLLTAGEEHVQDIDQARAQFADALKRIRDRGVDAEVESLLQGIEERKQGHRREADAVLKERRTGGDAPAIRSLFEERVLPQFEALEERIVAFARHQERALETDRLLANGAASDAKGLVIGIGFVTLALALGIAGFLSRTLSRQIGTSVQHVRSSSSELQASATQQASSAREQATAMNEISTTMGELLASSRQIAESAQRVARIAGQTADGSRGGDETVRQAQDSFSRIKRQVETIVQHMLDLGRKSQQIGGILEIVSELAEQTNILAINATIEAAGAGEAGRRFAVVGEEIRRLADRVGGSTKEIRTLIEEVRAAVNTTVMATETGAKTVESGSERFMDLARVLQEIGGLVGTTTEAAREIELSTKQQATAVEQVNAAITSLAQTTREAEAGSSQTLQTASQLADLSHDLVRLVQAQPVG